MVLRRAPIIALCIVVELIALRAVWMPRRLAHGQYERCYFETFDGVVGLAMDTAQHGYMAPDVDLDPDGRLSLPPGRTVAVPLEESTDYLVRTSEGGLAPYILLGQTESADNRKQAERPSQRLSKAKVVAAENGGLAWAQWNGSQPWQVDRGRLQQVFATCGSTNDGLSAVVRLEKGVAQVRLGNCRIVAPYDNSAGLRLVALSGPYWTTIEKSPGGWRTGGAVAWKMILAIAIVAIAAVALLGGLAAGIFAAWVAGLAYFGPVPAVLAMIIVTLTTFGAALWHAAVALGQSRAVQGALFAVFCTLMIAGAAVLLNSDFNPSARGHSMQHGHRESRCALIGYSTVRNDTLREGTDGVWQLLDRQCDTCSAATACYAKEAQRLDWVREQVCDSSFALQAHGGLAFLGGVNDDFFWRQSRLGQIWRLTNLLHYAYARPSAEVWQTFIEDTAASSLSMLEQQLSMIREIIGCAQQRGQHMVFAHDFLILDLIGGRGAHRQSMLQGRRAAVEEAGGRFVDLYERFGATAGVSFFNDTIHPSAIGHQLIAEAICQALSPGVQQEPE